MAEKAEVCEILRFSIPACSKIARISHKVSTAEAQSTMSTALHSLRLLDVRLKLRFRVPNAKR